MPSRSPSALAERFPILLACACVCALLVVAWAGGAVSRRHLIALLVATLLGICLLAFVISRAPARERATRLLLALVSLAATWGVIETLALTGIVDARTLMRAHGRYLWLEPGNRFDPELLWTREPNLRIAMERRRGNIAEAMNLPAGRAESRSDRLRYTLAYDRNGFRNDRDLDRADVAVVGDSFVEGAETPPEQLFTSILARATGLRVANLGLSGYGPQQALVALRRHAVPLAPDVVLWAFYEGNDLGDALRYEDWQRRLKEGLRTKPSAAERLMATNALDLLYRGIGRREASPLAAERHGTFRSAAEGNPRIWFVDPCDRLGVHERDGLVRFERCLREGQALAQREGFRLALVFVPNKFRVLRDHTTLPHHSECLDWECNDLPDRLRRLMVELGAREDFIDLTPELTAPVAAGRLTYLPDDTHWTPLGHQIVARRIGAYLRARGVRPGVRRG